MMIPRWILVQNLTWMINFTRQPKVESSDYAGIVKISGNIRKLEKTLSNKLKMRSADQNKQEAESMANENMKMIP